MIVAVVVMVVVVVAVVVEVVVVVEMVVVVDVVAVVLVVVAVVVGSRRGGRCSGCSGGSSCRGRSSGGGSGGPVIHNHPSLKRRLTVRECARIQTFPDTFKFSGSISAMYKQLGNAVPCKFSEHLAKIFQDAP